MQTAWQQMFLPSGEDDQVWEVFHENSKNGQYRHSLSQEQVLERMDRYHESLPFEGYPAVELPTKLVPLTLSLGEAILTRSSALSLKPCHMKLETVATLLHYAYGITRHNPGTGFPRPLRAVPSAGSLYPLEIFFHCGQVDTLQTGIYHYNPSKNNLRLIRSGDHSSRIANGLIQPHIGFGAALMIFITAIFERSVFKYGERGYRYALLEAGHLAQNVSLVSNAVGLACMNVGGFLDRIIDDVLALDGIRHSTIYMIALGEKQESTTADAPPA